jgi:GNAT superfamily N-acetyltransferase
VGELSLGGLASGQGRITLNYVAPAARFRGVSRAMLPRLEAELAARGCTEGLLTATATATRFYLAAGWRPAGPPRQGRWIFGQPMRKRLG